MDERCDLDDLRPTMKTAAQRPGDDHLVRVGVLLDAVLVMCGVATVAVVVALVFSESSCQDKQTSEKARAVGKLAQGIRDVRRRGNAELVWDDMAIGEPVYEKDSIFVGNNSSAVISFDDGGRIGAQGRDDRQAADVYRSAVDRQHGT